MESYQQDEKLPASINKNPGALGLHIESRRGGKGATVAKDARLRLTKITAFKAGLQEVLKERTPTPIISVGCRVKSQSGVQLADREKLKIEADLNVKI